MTLGLLGEIRNYSDTQKSTWVDYFDTFQNENDGLFYDPVVMNDIYADTDWWGARHLALHMINAYTDLGARPKIPFRFLRKYYDTSTLESWLNELDWNGRSLGDGDQDNNDSLVGPQEKKGPLSSPEPHSPFPIPKDTHQHPFSPTPDNEINKDFSFRDENNENNHLHEFMFFDQIVS